MTTAISSFGPTDSQLEPLERCAFVATSSGLGSVKSNGLASGLLKLIALAKSLARLNRGSAEVDSGAVIVAAKGDGLARIAVAGSRPVDRFADGCKGSGMAPSDRD
jgi:hypothetical protein